VVERRDHETLARIVELRLPARYEVIIAPPGDPSTKPRALNIALSSARGALLVVYDAEDAPSPDQLRFAASRFAVEKNTDCLQARLAIRNPEESWLSNGIMAQSPQAFRRCRGHISKPRSLNDRGGAGRAIGRGEARHSRCLTMVNMSTHGRCSN
jgi:cellulose synthase/poly-beta-1,6-N-acetylglucosamine synthase-like glycosyltransferase